LRDELLDELFGLQADVPREEARCEKGYMVIGFKGVDQA